MLLSLLGFLFTCVRFCYVPWFRRVRWCQGLIVVSLISFFSLSLSPQAHAAKWKQMPLAPVKERERKEEKKKKLIYSV